MTPQPSLSASLQPPYGLQLPGGVWGLDPSTHRLSVGAVIPNPDWAANLPHQVRWGTCSYSTSGSMDKRLARALGDLLRFFTDCRNKWERPAAIYLEEPFGGSDTPSKKGGKIIKPHPHSFYFVAVVLCALGHVFSDVEVNMIAPTTWKAAGLGKGNGFADKETIMAWARDVCGYDGRIEDEADALGIMAAGAVKEAQKHLPRGGA